MKSAMTLMPHNPLSAIFQDKTKKKFYENPARHRRIATGLKYSGIAIFCSWRAPQFRFKRLAPHDSILPHVELLSCPKSFFAF